MNKLDKKSLDNINLSGNIFRSNVYSLISIFEDSLIIRENRTTKLDQEIQSWSKENTGKSVEDIAPLGDEWMTDYNHYMHHFDYLLMHSLFISSFSLFENHLKRVVYILVLDGNPAVKPSDIKGKGEIDTLRKYLNLVFGLKSSSSDLKEWQDLLEYKSVRNALVHNGGILNKEKKNDLEKVRGFKIIKEHNVWYRTNSVYFRIKDIDFLKGFADLSVSYSKKLLDEINQKLGTKN